MNAYVEPLLKLDVAERLQIVEELWESVVQEGPVNVSPWKISEAEGRLDRLNADPASGRTWEQIMARLEGSA